MLLMLQFVPQEGVTMVILGNSLWKIMRGRAAPKGFQPSTFAEYWVLFVVLVRLVDRVSECETDRARQPSALQTEKAEEVEKEKRERRASVK